MSSPFASLVTETIPIESDPPNTATIRKLTSHEFEAAQVRDSARVWPAVLRSGVGNAGATIDFAAALRNPLVTFDRHAVVKAGLIGWTYFDGTPTAEQIADLDDDTTDLLARAILRLSKPALFLSPEAAQKEAEALAPRAGGTRADAA
jgi:hypothetical protein